MRSLDGKYPGQNYLCHHDARNNRCAIFLAFITASTNQPVSCIHQLSRAYIRLAHAERVWTVPAEPVRDCCSCVFSRNERRRNMSDRVQNLVRQTFLLGVPVTKRAPGNTGAFCAPISEKEKRRRKPSKCCFFWSSLECSTRCYW